MFRFINFFLTICAACVTRIFLSKRPTKKKPHSQTIWIPHACFFSLLHFEVSSSSYSSAVNKLAFEQHGNGSAELLFPFSSPALVSFWPRPFGRHGSQFGHLPLLASSHPNKEGREEKTRELDSSSRLKRNGNKVSPRSMKASGCCQAYRLCFCLFFFQLILMQQRTYCVCTLYIYSFLCNKDCNFQLTHSCFSSFRPLFLFGQNTYGEGKGACPVHGSESARSEQREERGVTPSQ